MNKAFLMMPALLLTAGIMLFISYESPAITWEPEAGQMYRLEMNSKICMFYQGKAADIVTNLRAVLNFKITQVAEGEINVSMQLSDITMSYNDIRNRAYEQLLSAPFQVRFGKNGEVLGYSFKYIGRSDEKYFRGIVSSLSCVMKNSLIGKWSNAEKDEYGTYSASYSSRNKGREIVKFKHGYTDSEYNVANFTGQTEISVIKSKARFTFSNKNSWITDMDSFEFIRFFAKDKKVMEVTKKVDLEPVGFNPDTGLTIWGGKYLPGYKTLYDSWADECDQCRGKEYSYDYQMEREAMKQQIADESIDRLLIKIVRSEGNDPKLIKKLKIFLTLYPECVKEIYDDTLRGRYKTGVLSVIMQAMAETGNENTQEYLRSIALEPKVGKTVNLMSTINIGFLQNPSDETLETLKQLYYNREGKMETMISNSSVLSLGRLASAMEGQEGGKEKRRQIAEFIAGELAAKSGDVNTAASCVAALGNIGDDEYFDTVESYLNSDSGFVRAATITALTKFNDESVPETLRKHFATEKDETARKKVIEGLAAYPVEQDSIDLIKEYLPGERSQSVRNVMLRYIAGAREHDTDVNKALQDALKNEKSNTNRDVILKALYSKKKNNPK